MTFSAIVTDKYEGRKVVVKDVEARTKQEAIETMRKNGYAVNPRKVKPTDVFNYIAEHTNMYEWDWDIKAVPNT